MTFRPSRAAAVVLAALAPTLSFAWSCSATNPAQTGGQGGSGASGGAGGGAAGGSGGASGGNGGVGGLIIDLDGGSDAPPDTPMNPCGTACGPTELCDLGHVGLDDDCDGEVDEDCPCTTGQAESCFKGDPSFKDAPGCFPGTQSCTENGVWGPCLGGVHATDNCANGDPMGCHPISAVPFADVDLKTGTGNFSADAVTESWSVACPNGVNPCPAVLGMNPADDFKPLVSGEYTVTYTKTLADNSTQQCTYPLFVGARGLRIELTWEFDASADGVDVDLHVHQPNVVSPWSGAFDGTDCYYANCTIDSFLFPFFGTPDWFAGVAPPDPVDWYEDPDPNLNSCYFAPRGVGADWQAHGQGCHNPRLDLDNISCDVSVQDVNDFSYCAPENINVDFPPQKLWTRIGVHYYATDVGAADIHPKIKIFCDGALAAELGSRVDDTGALVPAGYSDVVTFTEGDGSTRFWMVADVAYVNDGCSSNKCVVKPIYQDDVAQTPFLSTHENASVNFGPPYPQPLP